MDRMIKLLYVFHEIYRFTDDVLIYQFFIQALTVTFIVIYSNFAHLKPL